MYNSNDDVALTTFQIRNIEDWKMAHILYAQKQITDLLCT